MKKSYSSIFLTVCLLSALVIGSFNPNLVYAKAKNDITYSVTLKKGFDSDAKLDKELKDRLYSLLDYAIKSEELLNDSGRKFFVSDIKNRIKTLDKLQGYKNVGIEAKDVGKIKLTVKLGKSSDTELVYHPVETAGFKIEFGNGFSQATDDKNDAAKYGMDSFWLTLPYAAFPEDADEKQGEVYAELKVQIFE